MLLRKERTDAATKIQAVLRGKMLREKLIETMDFFEDKYYKKLLIQMCEAANAEVLTQEQRWARVARGAVRRAIGAERQ